MLVYAKKGILERCSKEGLQQGSRHVTRPMSCVPVPMPLSWVCVQKIKVRLVTGQSWILRYHRYIRKYIKTAINPMTHVVSFRVVP
jgi:hypothetical protein